MRCVSTWHLGFPLRYGGDTAAFSSLSAGNACLNLTTEGSEREWSWWGWTIFYVSDVDALYQEGDRTRLGRRIPPRATPAGASVISTSPTPMGNPPEFCQALGPPLKSTWSLPN